MAVIFAERTEIGNTNFLFSNDAGSASTTVAHPGSAFSFRQGGLGYCEMLMDASANVFYGQTRWRTGDAGVSSDRELRFLSPNFSVQVSISHNPSSKKLTVLRGGEGGTVLATGTKLWAPEVWYYLQFHFKIHDTAGEIEIWIDNEVETLTFGTGAWNTQDTRIDTATDQVSVVATRNASPFTGVEFNLDDLWINDTTGTDNTGLPDNIGIEALMPNGAGDVTGLSRGGTDSGANWSQVDEKPANDATDFVFDTVVNDYDLYNFPSTRWDSVAAVIVSTRAQKSDAGAGKLAVMSKYDTDASGTADTEDQSADIALSNSWREFAKYYNRQLATSWTPAKVNALQAGTKIR